MAVASKNLPLPKGGKNLAFTTLATILFLLSATFSLTLLRNKLTGAVTDTGSATVDSVDIIQAGTGQSVTINGTTMDEAEHGDNKSRRTILNNNIVKYKATYNVTKSGKVTFTFTLPPNNTVDESALAICDQSNPATKLSMAEVNGVKSYTNNRATCIRNVSSGQTTWDISTYLWGGNGEKIAPTLAVSGVESDVRPEAITLMGRPSYAMTITKNAPLGASNGINKDVYMRMALYGNAPEDTGVLGLEPIKNCNWSFTIDMSQMPKGWSVAAFSGMSGGGDNYVIYSGTPTASKDANGNLVISYTGTVTAVPYCPRSLSGAPGEYGRSDRCYYTRDDLLLAIPTSSLALTPREYSMIINNFSVDTNSGVSEVDTQKIDPTTWQLSNMSYGSPTANTYSLVDAKMEVLNRPYIGESFLIGLYISSNVFPDGDSATNLEYCFGIDPNYFSISGEFFLDKAAKQNVIGDYKIEYGTVNNGLDASTEKCGIVGDDKTNQAFFASPSEASYKTGKRVNAVRLHMDKIKAGIRDERLGSLPLVATKASLNNSWQPTYSASGYTDQWSIRDINGGSSLNASRSYLLQSIPGGLLRPTLTAIPTSNNPSRTEHITVTPYTYGQEQNGQISVNLPSGLTPTANSLTMGGVSISECSETVTNSCYTISNTSTTSTSFAALNPTNNPSVTSNEATAPFTKGSQDNTVSTAGSNTTTITFNLGTIGSGPTYPSECSASDIASNSTIEVDDGNGGKKLIQCLPEAVDGKDKDGNPQGVKQDSKTIEFDATVDKDVSVPSTLTISATANGTGTQYASDSFKTVSTKVTVANPPAEFGYNLTTTPANPTIYAKGNLAYNIESRNTTDNNVTDLTTINVLPYNDGLTYDLDKLSIDKDTAEGVKLYYTTDEVVRELDQSNPEALGKDNSDNGSGDATNNITWTECTLDKDGNCTNLPDQLTGSSKPVLGASNGVTAIKYTADTLPSGANPSVSYSISNIVVKDNGNITNNISYLSSSVLSSPVTHQNPNSVVYKGELLQLELDKKELTLPELKANTIDETSLSTTATVRTSTINGYSLTISPVTDGNGNGSGDDTGGNGVNNSTTSLLGTKAGANGKKLELPTLQDGQTLNKNTPAWAVKGGNQTNWTGFDQSKPTLDLHTSSTGGPDTQSIKTNFAISSGDVVADTYQGAVRYTLTAGI